MKIAIVCGHFMPEMGYVEVYIAHQLALKNNYNVAVITTALKPSYVKKIKTTTTYNVGAEIHPDYGYTIFRLNTFFSLGQMVLSNGITKTVQQFAPDLIIVIGVGKLFPYPVYKLHHQFKIVTLLGDSSDNQKNDTKKISIASIRKLLKTPVYKKAVHYSEVLFPYTPETIALVKKIIPASLHVLAEKKAVPISLGFDASKFYFDEHERNKTRKNLKIAADTLLLITATRIVSYKKLEQIIDWVDECNGKGMKLHYVIVGFFDDAYSQEVQQYIAQQKYAHQFTCLPFLPINEVRTLYAAADFGYFPTAVISIFEAMGTGLPLVLPLKENVSHILDNKTSGFYIENDAMELAFEKIIHLITDKKFNRAALVTQNQQNYSWKCIVEKVINSC